MSVSSIQTNDPLLQALWGMAPPATPDPTTQNGSATSSASAAAGINQDGDTLTLSLEAISLQASSSSTSTTQNTNTDGSANGGTNTNDLFAALNAFLNQNTGAASAASSSTDPSLAAILNQSNGASSSSTADSSLSALLSQISNGSSATDNLSQALSAFLNQNVNNGSASPAGANPDPSQGSSQGRHHHGHHHHSASTVANNMLNELEQQYAQTGGSKQDFVNSVQSALSQGQTSGTTTGDGTQATASNPDGQQDFQSQVGSLLMSGLNAWANGTGSQTST